MSRKMGVVWQAAAAAGLGGRACWTVGFMALRYRGWYPFVTKLRDLGTLC